MIRRSWKRRYSGSAGRTVNCQIGIFLAYSSLRGGSRGLPANRWVSRGRGSRRLRRGRARARPDAQSGTARQATRRRGLCRPTASTADARSPTRRQRLPQSPGAPPEESFQFRDRGTLENAPFTSFTQAPPDPPGPIPEVWKTHPHHAALRRKLRPASSGHQKRESANRPTPRRRLGKVRRRPRRHMAQQADGQPRPPHRAWNVATRRKRLARRRLLNS